VDTKLDSVEGKRKKRASGGGKEGKKEPSVSKNRGAGTVLERSRELFWHD